MEQVQQTVTEFTKGNNLKLWNCVPQRAPHFAPVHSGISPNGQSSKYFTDAQGPRSSENVQLSRYLQLTGED